MRRAYRQIAAFCGPGYARFGVAHGAIIGEAMTSLKDGSGLVLILVSLR